MPEDRCIVAVVVTWNRCELLAEALSAVLGQTRPPDRVIVVDNASTDGTADMVSREFATVTWVRTSHNVGGAGGFALGIREAMALPSCDLIWLMDDDTVPEATALEALEGAWLAYPGERPALVASRVVWTDGRDHPMNTPRVRPRATRAERTKAAAVGCLPIRSASFVSVLVDAGVVRERGLPIADYFLWNDDFEFTTRIIRGRTALACRSSVVVHQTATFGATDADPGARFFYEVRNKIWLFTRSVSLSPSEKVLYGGSTVVRWIRTIARSGDRRTLLAAFFRGAASAVGSGPRRTDDLLSGEPVQARRQGARGG